MEDSSKVRGHAAPQRKIGDRKGYLRKEVLNALAAAQATRSRKRRGDSKREASPSDRRYGGLCHPKLHKTCLHCVKAHSGVTNRVAGAKRNQNQKITREYQEKIEFETRTSSCGSQKESVACPFTRYGSGSVDGHM